MCVANDLRHSDKTSSYVVCHSFICLSVWPKHHAPSGTTSTVPSFHTEHIAAERKPSNWFCLWNNCVCVCVCVRACGQPPWLSVSLSVNSSGLHVVCERAFCTTRNKWLASLFLSSMSLACHLRCSSSVLLTCGEIVSRRSEQHVGLWV